MLLVIWGPYFITVNQLNDEAPFHDFKKDELAMKGEISRQSVQSGEEIYFLTQK